MRSNPTFLEFFAGGGMARAGLGDRWKCLLANDFDPMKAAIYRANWGDAHFRCEDIRGLTVDDLPSADLAWASFPCQDLSLAGNYNGLGNGKQETRSGAFWPFWRLMRGLMAKGRAPQLIVLENVIGALTANGGRDFAAIASVLSGAGYRFGAVVLDAKLFVPQSRQRVFWIAVAKGVKIPRGLTTKTPGHQPQALLRAYEGLTTAAKKKWKWWNIPLPAGRANVLADLIESEPTGVTWHSPAETRYILSLMSEANLAKVEAAKKSATRVVGGIYRRSRPDENGVTRQRAEVRFDDVAGCLRTPAGGSSRQTILVIENGQARSRLLSPREAARLMGLEDTYILPDRYNDAYHVAGDGVVAPVVRHIARCLLEPVLNASANAPALRAAACAEAARGVILGYPRRNLCVIPAKAGTQVSHPQGTQMLNDGQGPPSSKRVVPIAADA